MQTSGTFSSDALVSRKFSARIILLAFCLVPFSSCSKLSTLKSKIGKWFGGEASKSTEVSTDGGASGGDNDFSYFQVQKASFTDAIAFDGKLEASEKVDLRADKRIRLSPAKYKVAANVKRGDVLFVVDTKELEQKRAESKERVDQLQVDIKSSKAQFEFARKQLERKTGLVKKGIVAQKELEEAEKGFVAAESDLKTKELEIRKAERELVSASEGVTAANILSPIDGIIASIAPGGEEVNQGQQIAVVANPKDLAVTGQVDEISVTKIKIGQEVDISLDALKGKPVKGVIRNIEASQQRGGAMNVYNVKVELPQDVVKNNGLRVGYAAKVSVIFSSKDNALVIPRAAMKYEGDNVYLLVAESRGRTPTAKAVKIGMQTELEAEVKEGLKVGDFVVVSQKSGGGTQP